MSKPILSDNLNRMLREMQADIKDLQTGAAGPTFDALPVYPADGQEILFQADEANGVIWHLKYRATSTSAHKWEYIGGASLYGFTNGNTATVSSTTYITDAGGPSITIPLDGDYHIELGMTFFMAAANNNALISFAGTGVTANDVDALIDTAEVANNYDSSYTKIKKADVGAGTLGLRYRVAGSSATFSKRLITATPIRVG